jgi:hypothetical protein
MTNLCDGTSCRDDRLEQLDAVNFGRHGIVVDRHAAIPVLVLLQHLRRRLDGQFHARLEHSRVVDGQSLELVQRLRGINPGGTHSVEFLDQRVPLSARVSSAPQPTMVNCLSLDLDE